MVKTRDKLIDIARQLFAHKGIENTTMNDIAIAAEKGRRTIYTYFKNKRDIYNAVVETESDKVLSKLSEIAKLQIPADEKLMEFIFQRIATARCAPDFSAMCARWSAPAKSQAPRKCTFSKLYFRKASTAAFSASSTSTRRPW